MKIAFFIPHITRKPGFENNVSAHVQLPCEVARRLQDKGHHVEFLTDSLVDGYTLPVCLPRGVNVVPMVGTAFVTSAERAPLLKAIVSVFLFPLMSFRIRRMILKERYDVVHFYGTERIVLLSKLISLFGPQFPMAMTFNQYICSPLYETIRNVSFFWSQLGAVVVSMEQMKKRIPPEVNAMTIRHGVVKDLPRAGGQDASKRVLFWRTPDHLNGGDICIEVFRKLAPLYPEIDFDLAIRAESKVADLDAYEREIENGHVYRFPYSDGVTLASLLEGAICVFLPFRKYTYHPQFVILESLMMGIPVVASELPGVEEMVQAGKNGYVFPLEELCFAEEGIRKVLDGKIQCSVDIQEQLRSTWSWDGYEERLLTLYDSMISSL